ncbi:MAG TPA: RNA polymerase sigma factor [Streptosporangiaceae bacterium]
MNRGAQIAGAQAADPSAQPSAGDLDQVLAGALGGDREAFRLLYRDTHPRVVRYLRGLVGEDAEDVASEAWLQVIRDLHSFRGDVDGFRGWVATIARHRAIDHLRWQSRRPPASTAQPVEELTEIAAGDDTAAAAIDTVSTGAALALIATLPPDQAEAVMLRVVVGLDSATAAKVLGRKPGAVRMAAHRGLRNLARQLAQGGVSPPAELPGKIPSGRPQRPRGRPSRGVTRTRE